MFSVGDYVVHRSSGICKVKEIAPLPMSGGFEDTDYYFLTPINGKGSEIFYERYREFVISLVLSHCSKNLK